MGFPKLPASRQLRGVLTQLPLIRDWPIFKAAVASIASEVLKPFAATVKPPWLLPSTSRPSIA